MKRPYPVHFLALKTNEFISIRTSISLSDSNFHTWHHPEKYQFKPSRPVKSISLLWAHEFMLKIRAYNHHHKEIFTKSYTSDSFGNFSFKIPIENKGTAIKSLQVFETSRLEGVELLLGTYLPTTLAAPKKIIISDLDKTLVDTRSSTPGDIYYSLTHPLESYPTVKKSMDIMMGYINNGFHPFIVSASPHFYENTIRDWLYRNGIYDASIFLKDYRHFLSISEGHLSPKDIKSQGPYKLGHLFDIILMTGVPEEIVLVGDDYESDPIIYMTFACILQDRPDPWQIWNEIRHHRIFKLRGKQHSYFLGKMYQVKSLLQKSKINTKIKILIRKTKNDEDMKLPFSFLRSKQNLVETFF